jgi:hypothetical protein
MVTGIAGPETKNNCAGEDLQEITRPDIWRGKEHISTDAATKIIGERDY